MRLDLLIPLVAGHLIGDFVLQSDEMVRRRGDLAVVLVHALIVALVSWILTGHFATWWWLVPAIVVTHLAIDVTKDAMGKRLDRQLPGGATTTDSLERNGRVVLFALDQLAHLIVLVLLAAAASAVPVLARTATGDGLWNDLAGASYLRGLTLASGWVLVALTSGHFLGLLLRRFEDELSEAQKGGLPGGGYWIGVTERSLIYLFILIGEPSGIGFLAAAKSVFRIGELKEAQDRKLAEYILIGTLVSFTVAMVIGLLAREVLAALA